MKGQSGIGNVSSESPLPPVYLVGAVGDRRERLASRLATLSGLDIETVTPGEIPDAIGTAASGVICLSPPPSDHAGGDSREANGHAGTRPLVETISALDRSALDCPLIVAGTDIDAETVYRAGATDLVPLAVDEHVDTVVDRIAAIVDRSTVSGRAVTDSDSTVGDAKNLMNAFSTAFPDYAFVYDENGRYLDVMTGRRTDDRLYTDDELLDSTVHDHLETATADRLVGAIREALSAGQVRNIEYCLDRGDGVSWYHARIAPLAEPYRGQPAVVLVARDITERKQRERELERGRRRFDALFNHPRSLVTLLDTDGRIVEISDAAVALVDVPAESIRDRPLWEGPWFEGDPDLQTRLRDAVQRATDGENTRVEADVPLPDMELVIDAVFQPIREDDGTISSVLGVARDITEQRRDRRIRQELLSTTRTLMRVETTDELARTVSEATASILGHDLNVVYLRDEADTDTGPTLSPVAWSGQTDERLDRPPVPADDGPVAEAYRRGEPVVCEDYNSSVDRPIDQSLPVTSLLAVPLGEYGVLTIGDTRADAFDETDVEQCRLLTVNAGTALDRIERRRDLKRYETLFETVRDKLYVLDEDGYIRMVTDSLAEQLGYDPGTLQGKPVSSILTEETDREGKRLILDMLVTPDTVSNSYEGRMVARDGEETPIEIELSILPYEDSFRGTVGTVRDISERRQREQELSVFREAITEAGIGLAMYGPDGRFEFVNHHYAELLGQTRDAIENTHVWTVFEDQTREGFGTYWHAFSAGETRTTETEHLRADGSTVAVETVTTAVEIDGSRHHLVTVQDITDRRERRQQAAALHRILRHNLRNDLTVIYAHVTRLTEELPDRYHETIDTLVETTEGLIDLAETATQARTLVGSDTSRKPIEVTGIVRETAADVRSEFDDATVDLELPETQYVRADPNIGVAVHHLLTNAIEHNESASPRAWVRVGPAGERDDWVVIEVADDGPGIPDIEQETLASGDEDPLQHGVGMGLWIVQWIVSRYGGDLTFEDRDPRGSRVRIALPAAEQVPADTAAAED